MTSNIRDLGIVGWFAECPKCGKRLNGQFVRYYKGNPGLEGYAAECRRCGIEVRWKETTHMADRRGNPSDILWTTKDGLWGIIGIYDGPVGPYHDAKRRVEVITPDDDTPIPIILFADGEIQWGYRETDTKSEYPEELARQCESMLGGGSNTKRTTSSQCIKKKSATAKPKSKASAGGAKKTQSSKCIKKKTTVASKPKSKPKTTSNQRKPIARGGRR